MNNELTLRIVLERPPAGVNFGLQKGSGSENEVIEIQSSAGQDLKFHLSIQVKISNQKGSEPRFLGPFVQGKAGEQFCYINSGVRAGQVSQWDRRLKVPLSGITWEMISVVASRPGSVLETHVAGTAKDGGPNCATVKPFAGWTIRVH